MPVFSLTRQELRALQPTTFAEAGFSERGDLQRLLREQIDVIAPGTLVIAEEFADWEDSRRRIDLLGVDKSGDLVVIELKRTEDGGHVELQALRYAAMVSAMTFDQAVGFFSRYLAAQNDKRDARQALLEHLNWEEPRDEDFAQDVKIVLAAAGFHPEVTTTVMWLNERKLNIRCISMQPYFDHDRVFVDVRQVIPLPGAEKYQVRIREKEQRERDSRQERTDRQTSMLEFWTQLLEVSKERTSLFENVVPKAQVRIFKPAAASVGGLRFDYFVGLDKMRVGLEINRSQSESKVLFDQLYSTKSEIESAFGKRLDWQRLDDQHRSRVDDFPIPCPGVAVKEAWPEMIEQLVESMIRFEAALRPHLDRLTL